ncbi:MAG: hypothetical protein PHE24_06400 [Patescibacteria group bacterium]|nr:hypothetical protein [Patescibacteria group bacterium]
MNTKNNAVRKLGGSFQNGARKEEFRGPYRSKEGTPEQRRALAAALKRLCRQRP